MKSSLLNLSHSVKCTAKMGYLLPIACFDGVPGDKIKHKMTALLRTIPLAAPLMHACDIDIHAYFSPDRIVWDGAEDFHTGGDDGLDSTVWPYMEAPASTGYLPGSLADYLGLPTGVPGYQHSALPFRHYAKIYNEHYRDSQLQSKLTYSTASGLDTTTNRTLVNACWKRDYFTKCRPEPQLGPDVTIPLTGNAPVVGTGQNITMSGPGASNSALEYSATANVAVDPPTGADGSPIRFDATDETSLETDLSSISAVEIRDLREASAWQRFLEFNNIWGGRYIEQIMARFGQRVPDYRLQIPEFLGAGSAKFQFSEVLQTGVNTVGEGLANLGGHGISLVGSNTYNYTVKEHGWFMVFMIIRPKTQYSQGVHKSWSRTSKFDYLLPEFQHIGDQPVTYKEIQVGSATPNGVFGYTPRYEEYRTVPSRVAGLMRPGEAFDDWTMSRDLPTNVALNGTFVTCTPTTRVYTDTTGDNVILSVDHTIHARRRLSQSPKYLLK